MTPGEQLDQAHKVAARAMGQIVFMLIKQRISRATLEWCAGELEKSARIIRSLLTTPGPSG